MISTNDIERIRADQNLLMSDTVYIQRLTRTSDGAGGWSEAWQTVSTVVGRIAPSQRMAGETVQGGAVTAYGEYIITLPHDADIGQDDRLQINGVQYEVKAILDRSAKTALRVLASKL